MDHRRYDILKRGIDVVVAAMALLVSLPTQGLIAVLVRRDLGAPVLFRQERPGLDEQVFELVKFRTMHHIDVDRGLETDEQRLTRFGIFLRRTSLDELPTLWNVLKGDMSLVGPRPLLVSYLDRYAPEQRQRHRVRPGITGLAQVSGRNSISWEDKFALDNEYIDHRSALMDLRIILRTMVIATTGSGVSAHDHATSQEFLGGSSEHR